MNRIDPTGLTDYFLGINANGALGEEGGDIGAGIYWDSNNPSNSGAYFSSGTAVGVGGGVAIMAGAAKDINGNAINFNINTPMRTCVTPSLSTSNGQPTLSAGAFGYGAGGGATISQTNTQTVTISPVVNAYNSTTSTNDISWANWLSTFMSP